MLEKHALPQFKWGETIAGSCVPVIKQLGLWHDFALQGHLPCFGSRSVWSESQSRATASIHSPFGHGWHLDRVVFETQLRQAMQAAGVHLLYGRTLRNAQPNIKAGWTIQLDDGCALKARFVLDASGRRRTFSKLMGHSTRVKLPQCALSRIFSDQQKNRSHVEIEATEIGWWYRAPLPDGNCIVTLITDRSLWPRSHSAKAMQWQDAFERTTLCSALRPPPGSETHLLATNADVSLSAPLAGTHWLAVGDAALTLDPLSGSGIEMALRGGIKAAQACANALAGEAAATKQYITAVQHYFHQHLKLRQSFYAMESRWSHSDFWRKRQQENPGTITTLSQPA